MSNIDATEIKVNGVRYVPKGSESAAKAGPKNRHVVVMDRGWIICGDLEAYYVGPDLTEKRIKLRRPVLVRHWSSIGISGVLRNPKSDEVTLEKLDHVPDMPGDVELFRFGVDDDWGL